jgi:hypothetical protein
MLSFPLFRELKELFQDFQSADVTKKGDLDRIEFCEYEIFIPPPPLSIDTHPP